MIHIKLMTYDIPGNRTGWGGVMWRIYKIWTDSPPARHKMSSENS